MYGDYYQVVVYTAIIHICMRSLSCVRNRILKMYMFIRSLMVEILLLHQEKDF